jgi:hypothetical protein
VLEAGSARVRVRMKLNNFVDFPNLPAALGLGFTQLLTEMRTESRKIMFLWSRTRPVGRANNLTAICEPTV